MPQSFLTNKNKSFKYSVVAPGIMVQTEPHLLYVKIRIFTHSDISET